MQAGGAAPPPGSRRTLPAPDGAAPGRGLGAEPDGASQRGAAGERRRYFLASAARAERDRRVRRVRLGRAGRPAPHAPGAAAGAPRGAAATAGGRPGKLALPAPAFIPLADDAGSPKGRQREGADSRGAGGGAAAEDGAADGAGESHEMYLLRRTRELNAAVRAAPYQLQLWLDFAAFQDEATQCARCDIAPCLPGRAPSLPRAATCGLGRAAPPQVGRAPGVCASTHLVAAKSMRQAWRAQRCHVLLYCPLRRTTGPPQRAAAARRPALGRPRPGVAAAAAEKKAAILEQALGHHPGSDELLLTLLGAAEAAAPADEVRPAPAGAWGPGSCPETEGALVPSTRQTDS